MGTSTEREYLEIKSFNVFSYLCDGRPVQNFEPVSKVEQLTATTTEVPIRGRRRGGWGRAGGLFEKPTQGASMLIYSSFAYAVKKHYTTLLSVHP